MPTVANDVVTVTFDELSGARKAMQRLRELADEEGITIRGAAVVVRERDGRFWVPEDEERIGFVGTATGGAVGALLGALAGPLGLLFWGATGAIVGSLVDAEEADVSEEVLRHLTERIPAGTVALVADIDEPVGYALDATMEELGGRVSRRPRADIEAELAAAEEAVDAARREAQRVLRERRRAAGEESLADRLQDLKERVTPR